MEKIEENMSFEEALRELEQIVKKIDGGSENLDEAVKAFERGSLLKAHCERKLEEAKLKIEKVINQDHVGEHKTVEITEQMSK